MSNSERSYRPPHSQNFSHFRKFDGCCGYARHTNRLYWFCVITTLILQLFAIFFRHQTQDAQDDCERVVLCLVQKGCKLCGTTLNPDSSSQDGKGVVNHQLTPLALIPDHTHVNTLLLR